MKLKVEAFEIQGCSRTFLVKCLAVCFFLALAKSLYKSSKPCFYILKYWIRNNMYTIIILNAFFRKIQWKAFSKCPKAPSKQEGPNFTWDARFLNPLLIWISCLLQKKVSKNEHPNKCFYFLFCQGFRSTYILNVQVSK